MLNDQDQDFLEQMKLWAESLYETGNLSETAKQFSTRASSIFNTLLRRGYRVRYRAFIEPIHAPVLETDRQAVDAA